ncbi:histidine kinase [Paenibacillus darwinianus]|uniref:Circadian input-output histidine kinase CikA n=1 Tax=Paenibacillus darwinianus TaxID=1380763 RepID=A0A9W5W6M3_9BACL|nr:response regulator [Paenibacillus darwinianus]EXX86028.1 histidine kinase [Paenibacillus darwinianus]EXX86159.1 histidine kinase [Paenibacillus darwinianus]EXX86482.1 histidine kinase [Paenibacillus darwinianus]
MRIRSKLLIGSGILIALIILVSGLGISNIKKANGNVEYLYQDRYQKLVKAYELRSEVNNLSKFLTNIATLPTRANLESNRREMDTSYQAAVKALTELNGSSTTEEERLIMQDLVEAGRPFNTYRDRIIALVEAGKGDEARALRESEGLRITDDLVRRVNYLTQYYNRNMDGTFMAMFADNRETFNMVVVSAGLGLLLAFLALYWNMMSITQGLQSLSVMIRGYASGTIDPGTRIRHMRKDEFGDVARTFNLLADDLERRTMAERAYKEQIEEDNWIQSNLADVTVALQHDADLDELASTFMDKLVPLAGASYGALYVREGLGEQPRLKLHSAYARDGEADAERVFAFGEGLVGQCAASGESIKLADIPDDYIRIRSGMGESKPKHVLLCPVKFRGQVVGVLELAHLAPIRETQMDLVSELAENLGIMLNSLFGRMRVQDLLKESQALTEELQVQSEELISQQEALRRSNERLEEQTKQLKKSKEVLQSQQEELERTNDELLQKTHLLELQMKQTEQKNEQIEKSKMALERQTVQLALSSKYKSEFLANMSHELRTPLNSLLVLSQMLMDNKDGNLTPKQVEFASTIYGSGSDLLKLIDEILDLSKINAGKMEVVTEPIPIIELARFMERNFGPVGAHKGIEFIARLENGLPEEMYTDSHRVKQILKNLLSNAFKFTEKGGVELIIRKAGLDEFDFGNESGGMIAFDVKDTGIGIPADKQKLIFEAFHQVDGTTSRIYGGTGLGLAISRELAELLGGGIRLESEEGTGSMFTLYIPEFHVAKKNTERLVTMTASPSDVAENMVSVLQAPPAVELPLSPERGDLDIAVDDDADRIEPADKVVLIIEDDVNFAKVLLDMARSRGFKGIVALQGDKGLALAHSRQPDAILLDIQLPVMDGWAVLNQLKHHADTRHIPVHVISVVDDIQQGLSMGALAYIRKPSSKDRLEDVFFQIESFIERDMKRLLVVEDDPAQRTSIIELIGHDDVLITAVSTGKDALKELESLHYDCMVLDLGLPDISGFELLDAIRRNDTLQELPIIIYTGRDLDKKEELQLKKFAGTIIIKDVRSPERLLDETTLFLHRVEANLPEDKRNMLRKLHSIESIFEGKNILIVDDDIRNVFALSSVLEGYRMNITFAENGREALELLEKSPNFDMIIMDIMMPDMDGYETMQAIRQQTEFQKLPIIAITAKAMKDDRDKCIEAGASDYIAKPVHTEQLLSLMRVWLYQ